MTYCELNGLAAYYEHEAERFPSKGAKDSWRFYLDVARRYRELASAWRKSA
jgi:hypothetical protein